jgi:hypothetical protein
MKDPTMEILCSIPPEPQSILEVDLQKDCCRWGTTLKATRLEIRKMGVRLRRRKDWQNRDTICIARGNKFKASILCNEYWRKYYE